MIANIIFGVLLTTTIILLWLGLTRGNGWITAIGGVFLMVSAFVGLRVFIMSMDLSGKERRRVNMLRKNAELWANKRTELRTKYIKEKNMPPSKFALDVEVSNLVKNVNPNATSFEIRRAIELSQYKPTYSDNWLRDAERPPISKSNNGKMISNTI